MGGNLSAPVLPDHHTHGAGHGGFRSGSNAPWVSESLGEPSVPNQTMSIAGAPGAPPPGATIQRPNRSVAVRSIQEHLKRQMQAVVITGASFRAPGPKKEVAVEPTPS